jgi:hypothetical protein
MEVGIEWTGERERTHACTHSRASRALCTDFIDAHAPSRPPPCGAHRDAPHTISRCVRGEGGGQGGWNPLLLAAYGGYTEVVEILLAAGADVDARLTVTCPPLHLLLFPLP